MTDQSLTNDLTKVTTPEGVKPPDTFRFVREGTNSSTPDPDRISMLDKSHDIPVSTSYRRHTHPLYDPDKVTPNATRPSELLGWSVVIDCHMFSTQVEIKLCRNPRRMEVWVAGERVSVTDKPFDPNWCPPITIGFDVPAEYLKAWMDGEPVLDRVREGWASKLGKTHQAAKHLEQVKTQPRVEPTESHCSKCWKLDDGDMVDKEGVQFCMVCFLREI